jgi:hypothetical protein
MFNGNSGRNKGIEEIKMITLGVILMIGVWMSLAAVLKKQSYFRVKFIARIGGSYPWYGKSGYKVQRRNPVWLLWYDDTCWYDSTANHGLGHYDTKYWKTEGEAVEQLKYLVSDLKGEIYHPQDKVVYTQ